MTRHPTARRAHHSDAEIDDIFVARAIEASTWASRNRQAVTIGAIAAVALILGLLYYAHYRSSLADRANTELTQVRAVVLNGDPKVSVPALEKYLAQFGHTKAAPEAK